MLETANGRATVAFAGQAAVPVWPLTTGQQRDTLAGELVPYLTAAAGAGVLSALLGNLGITVPGFPSLYLMYGPNTNTSGGSIIVYLEAQAA